MDTQYASGRKLADREQHPDLEFNAWMKVKRPQNGRR